MAARPAFTSNLAPLAPSNQFIRQERPNLGLSQQQLGVGDSLLLEQPASGAASRYSGVSCLFVSAYHLGGGRAGALPLQRHLEQSWKHCESAPLRDAEATSQRDAKAHVGFYYLAVLSSAQGSSKSWNPATECTRGLWAKTTADRVECTAHLRLGILLGRPADCGSRYCSGPWTNGRMLTPLLDEH